ncbi:MAG: phosphate acyltransferase PlsX [Pseudomonadales bacterium]|nr:phosphate acyltransferase PlsX [Pseudomonadales bacterium]
MRIAVDVMGGDQGVLDIVLAGVRCIEQFDDLSITFAGNEQAISDSLGDLSSSEDISVHATEVVVNMSDKPASALRHKKQSSMHSVIEMVRDGTADACVSAGNTGALMAIGRHLLKTIPGVDRPAIIKAIPSSKGQCYLLDLGANINCDAENLVQFAAMGSLMCQVVDGVAAPKVGLLNIGEEALKGGVQVREAADLLNLYDEINYIGFVEGDGIYLSDADVIVCDGWVGNIALKTSEGLAKYILQKLDESFKATFASRAAGIIASPVLGQVIRRLSPEQYNGASLLGLNGIVVKSHGHSTIDGFSQAIQEAMKAVKQNLPEILQSRLSGILGVQ